MGNALEISTKAGYKIASMVIIAYALKIIPLCLN